MLMCLFLYFLVLHNSFYKILSNNTFVLIGWLFYFTHLKRYSEDNANVSQVVYVDDYYSTSFYFVYPPQAKILGEFSVTTLFKVVICVFCG